MPYITQIERTGIAKGMAKGIAQGIAKVALRMLKADYPRADILEVTGLSEEELLALESQSEEP